MNEPESAAALTILFRFTGEDRPGLTASLSDHFACFGCLIIDVNQAVIHRSLLLGIMVRVPEDQDPTLVIRKMRRRAEKLELKCKHTVIADAAYDDWIGEEGKSRYILTLLSRAVTAEQFAAVSQLVADQGLNIDVITRLSGRPKRVVGH